jgi:hypothetical protein
VSFVKIGEGKVLLSFRGVHKITLTLHTVQEWDILQLNNALVNSVSYATKYTVCSVIRITTVHNTWTNEMRKPSLLLRMCMYCSVQFVFTVF